MRALLAPLTCLLLACGGGGEIEVPPPGPGPSLPPSGKCEAVEQSHVSLPSPHVDECSTLTDGDFSSNPPSSGAHYGVWAAFKSYTQPMPRGYYLHSLEHGGVAFLYNCPEGCPDDVAALQAIIDQLPSDPRCTAPAGPRRRMILAPEPNLKTRFAAAAWLHTLSAPCVEAAAFDAFARDHYAKGPEDICIDGTDVVARGIAPGCGQ